MSLHQYVDPGDPLPPIAGHSSRGRLERLLREGKFAVTAELNPPDSADPQDVYDRALVLSEVCDAINATDASGANVHMSSVGICTSPHSAAANTACMRVQTFNFRFARST